VARLAFLFVCVTCESRVTATRPAATPEHRPAKTPPNLQSCSAWTSRILRDDDAGNQRTWRDVTIRSLAQACDAVPETIRTAAARANGTKDAYEQFRILAAAATASLGGRCSIADPVADARQLAKACPPPKGLRFRLDESVLTDIRAVDYGVLLVLLQSLMSAGEYNDAAERVVLNFTLSAQFFGEDFRKGRTPRGRD
jgi:hypothetical protein